MIFNFKNIFDKYGRAWIQELSANIRQQSDIDGSTFQPVIRRVRSHQRRGQNVKAHTVQGKRLVYTGKFNQGAFVYIASEKDLSLQGNDASYDGTISYSDIIRLNDKGYDSPRASDPNLFPKDETELKNTKTWNQFMVDFNAEVQKQLNDQIKINIKKTLNL